MARLQVDMCHSGGNFLGICTGHFCQNPISEPCVWFARAEKRIFRLGWGRLNAQDITRIANLLQEDELVILVPEREIFDPHNFPTEEQRQFSPVEFVMAKCQIIIAPGRLLAVTPSNADSQQKKMDVHGATFETLPRHEVSDFIRHPKTPSVAA